MCSGDGISVDQIVNVLGGLIAKSMVQMSAADNVQSARYDLLDTLGEYARERRELAGEADSVRASHVAWHLEAAEHVDDELRRTEQEWWADWLEKEHGNFVQ